MVWGGLAIGVVAGGAGDNAGAGGGAGAGEKKSAQGLFSLWGHQVWLYLGGILGWGDNFGPYVTTGPMIGSDMDWAVGGGLHIKKVFGLGLVVPLRQAFMAAPAATQKVGEVMDQGQIYAGKALETISQVGGADSLESVVTDPMTAAAAGLLAVGTVCTSKGRNVIGKAYDNVKSSIFRNTHYL
jgi:hypothetical protein